MEKNIREIIEKTIGLQTMITSSKGQYKYDNPHNVVIFNSNICTKEDGKISSKDIDLTIDEDRVKQLSMELGRSVFILSEMSGRFENEDNPNLEDAIYTTNGKDSFFDENYFIRDIEGRLINKPTVELSIDEIRVKKEKIKKMFPQEQYEMVNLKFDCSEELLENDPEEYSFYNSIDTTKFFENLNKEISPLHQFQNWLQDDQSVNLQKDFTNYYVTKETYEEIKDLVNKWYSVFHGGCETEYRKEKNLNWLMFNNGPSCFIETPDWAEEGRLYRKVEKG